MNFNKTTEYALRILSLMAADDTKLYSADEIFQNLNIPYRYLRKQLTILSKSGLMLSVQGIKGGYKLAKKNEDISLLDIISASGEDFISNMCFFGIRECTFGQKCAMHDKWAVVKENIRQVLKTTTLADLKKSGPPNFTINNNLLNT
jgi:Rrf2 family transcriptional regulator, iron-sulfur cluster assembly transcription factor